MHSGDKPGERMRVPSSSRSTLRDALKAQARLRLTLALPTAALSFTLCCVADRVPAVSEALALAYLAYALAGGWLATSAPERHHSAMTYASAVIDPIFVTAWMLVLNEASPLISSFYLFLLIDYCIRSEAKGIFACQLTTLGGLAGIYLLDDYWRTHWLALLGLAISIAIIPLYLSSLLHRLRTALSLAEAENRAKSNLPATTAASGSNRVSIAPSTQPKRILLVDDDLTDLHPLREILRLDGHVVTTAEDGGTALELMRGGETWDLVFLNVNLPDMTGTTVLQTYRFGTSRPVPVYFLTSDASLVTKTALAQAGVMGLLAKPIRGEEIRAAIARAASDSPSETRMSETRKPEAREAGRPALRAVPVIYVETGVIEGLAGLSKRPTFLAEMIERALSDIDRNVRNLTSALADGDAESIWDAAHVLKAVAQAVGAVRLANLAISMTRSDPAALAVGRQSLIDELRKTTAGSVAALKDITASRPQAVSTGTAG